MGLTNSARIIFVHDQFYKSLFHICSLNVYFKKTK